MKKRISISYLLAAALVLLAGCAGAGEETAPDPAEEESFRFVVATDLHYLAPSLTDHGEIFWRVMEAGDGKVTEFCEEITDAFLEEVRAENPDALILTGDLSFNGERESHLALAEKLAAFEESGVPVLVLPGNHDVYRQCYSFLGSEGQPVETVSSEDFAEIYSAFGFGEAVSRDSDSLSYVAQLNDSARVLMLDADTFHDFCSLSGETLSWIEKCLPEAASEGQPVLAACHQNLYRHTMFGSGYMLGCADALHALLEKYGVTLFLSGHLHVQHILTEGNVTEIATSSLTMGACQYGVLTRDGGAMRYETRSVDVASWAADRSLTDGRLADFAGYAMGRMEDRTREQAQRQLALLGFPEEEIRVLADYACALHGAYFRGNLSGIPALDPDGSVLSAWKESGSSFGSYFGSIEQEIGRDHTHWEKLGNIG